MTVAPKWVCIAINETQYFDIDPEDQPWIERIDAVYIYDEHSLTYACSATPDYQLYGLYYSIVFKPEANLDDSEFMEYLWEKYESCAVEDGLFEKYPIDAIDQSRKHIYGAPDDWEELEDRGYAEVREYYQGNHKF